MEKNVPSLVCKLISLGFKFLEEYVLCVQLDHVGLVKF